MRKLAVGILASIPIGFFSLIIVFNGWLMALKVLGILVGWLLVTIPIIWALDELT